MTVTLGKVTLCHGADLALGHFAGPEGLRLSLAREVQVRQAIGAGEVSLAARKNAVWTVSFGATAEFASEAAALGAAQRLAADIRETGETPAALTMSHGSDRLTWSQAVVTGFEAEPIGCTLRVIYALTASQQETGGE